MKKLLLLLALAMGLNFSGSLFAESDSEAALEVESEETNQSGDDTGDCEGTEVKSEEEALEQANNALTAAEQQESASQSNDDAGTEAEQEQGDTGTALEEVADQSGDDASTGLGEGTGLGEDTGSGSGTASGRENDRDESEDDSSSSDAGTGSDSEDSYVDRTTGLASIDQITPDKNTKPNTDADKDTNFFVKMFGKMFSTGSTIRTGVRVGWTSLGFATLSELGREIYVEFMNLRSIDPRNLSAPRLSRSKAFFKAMKNVLSDVKNNARNHKLLLGLGAATTALALTDAVHGLVGNKTEDTGANATK